MTRVLVTGASGFIGRHVAEAAWRKGLEVVVLVRNGLAYGPPPHPAVVVEGDMRDGTAVRSALDGCSAVIHVAGLYTFDPAKAALMHDINAPGRS